MDVSWWRCLAYIDVYERDAALLATTVNVVMLSDFGGEGYVLCIITSISAIGPRGVLN